MFLPETTTISPPAHVCALKCNFPGNNIPHIWVIIPMTFAINNSFPGSLKLDFGEHSTGISCTLLYHLDFNAYHVVDESDVGDRVIKSRGLLFVSNKLFLDSPSIAAVVNNLDPFLIAASKPHWTVVMY